MHAISIPHNIQKDYENQGLIGYGTFGDVIKLVHKHNPNQIIANKAIMLEELQVIGLSQKEIEAELLKEIQLLIQISNEPIAPQAFPKFIGFNREISKNKSVCYNLHFEYFPFSLKALIEEQMKKNQYFPFPTIYKYSKSLLCALCFLQIMGICHRDLKPANILVNSTKENVIIIDFGISQNVSEQLQKQNTTKLTLGVEGTKIYFSPELALANKREISQIKINPFKSDVYSFAVIIAELWLFKRPRISANHIDQDILNIINALNTKTEEVEAVDFKKYSKYFDLVQRALTKKVNDRPDFLDLFRNFLRNPIDQMEIRKIKMHVLIDDYPSKALSKIFDKGKNFLLLSSL